MLGAQTGTNLMALCAFPIIFAFGGGDEARGFIYLTLIAGVTAMCIHAITLYTVREPTTSQGIDRVSGSLLNAVGLNELITTSEKDYEDLITTRKRQLEKPLNEIESLNEKIAVSYTHLTLPTKA